MKLTIVEKTFLAGLQCTLTSSCAKTEMEVSCSVIFVSQLSMSFTVNRVIFHSAHFVGNVPDYLRLFRHMTM